MVTLTDVAELAGVSRMTASNALRGKSIVRPETIERVKQAAQQLHYEGNLSARKLRSGRSGILYFGVVDLDLPFPSQMAAAFCDVAVERGLKATVQQTRSAEDYSRFVSQSVSTQLCDAAALSAHQFSPEDLHILDAKVPTVLFDDMHYSSDFDHVVLPNRSGAQSATEHLIAQGCRQPLFLGTAWRDPDQFEESWKPSLQRLKGFSDACEHAGIKIGPQDVFDVDWAPETARRTIHDIVESKRSFDAIFCASDCFASGVLRGLYECGLTVPGDVAVVSFEGTQSCPFLVPSLTSVSLDYYEIAGKLIDRMLWRIKHRDETYIPKTIVPGFSLDIRESSLRK